MAGITLEIAEKHLQTWLEAEEAVSTGQGYTIGSRTLTRANLTEIGNRIKYWDNIVKNLESVAKNKGRNKVRRVVPHLFPPVARKTMVILYRTKLQKNQKSTCKGCFFRGKAGQEVKKWGHLQI
jgi:hypothetical protein